MKDRDELLYTCSQKPGKSHICSNVHKTTAEHTPSVEIGMIKGKATFAELLEWGLKAEVIQQALGKPVPVAPGMTVKDFYSANGLEFETSKPALQAELDRIAK